MKTQVKFELIVTIVKKGFSDYVISAARSALATGATVITGMGSDEAQKQFLGLELGAEKEIVLIVTKKLAKKRVMNAILESQDFSKEGAGICFSMPITNAVGLAGALN